MEAHRWWKLPGEVLWTGEVAGAIWKATFVADDGCLWAMDFLREGRHDVHGEPTRDSDQELGFRVDWDHTSRTLVTNGNMLRLPGSLHASLHTTLRARSPNPVTTEQKSVLDFLALRLYEDEWTSGRRLRSQAGVDSGTIGQLVEALQPRYVRCDFGDDDFYSLTLPGLLASQAAPWAQAEVERVLQLLRAKFAKDPDFTGYGSEELGVGDRHQLTFLRAVVSISWLLSGGSGGDGGFRWSPPRDVEHIVQCGSFGDFLKLVRQGTGRLAERRVWSSAPAMLPAKRVAPAQPRSHRVDRPAPPSAPKEVLTMDLEVQQTVNAFFIAVSNTTVAPDPWIVLGQQLGVPIGPADFGPEADAHGRPAGVLNGRKAEALRACILERVKRRDFAALLGLLRAVGASRGDIDAVASFVRELAVSKAPPTNPALAGAPTATEPATDSSAPPEFMYEVALSFAGEDRAYAEELAVLLKAQGVRVFYDAYEEGPLWGVDLYDHLHEVYSRQARYCVLFASKHYAAKAWTTHERRAAQERAFREKGTAYILPVRIDDTPIPGLATTIGFLGVDKGMGHIASLLVGKIRGARSV